MATDDGLGDRFAQWNPKRWLGGRARRMIKASVDSRFDDVVTREIALMSQLEDLANRIASVEAALARSDLEVDALRQQVEEALDFLRIEHEVSRDALDEVKRVGAELRSLSGRLEAGPSAP